MKFLVTLSCLALTAALSAAPKFAVIRVTDIYRDLPSTAAMQEEISQRRDAISVGPRAEGFRQILKELQDLESVLKENKDKIDSEKGAKLIREFEIKRQEAETLRQDYVDFETEENKRINREMVAGMRESLKRINDAATQIANERNLDGVWDISGNSNTGVPFVLYSNDALDITDDVIGVLNEKPLEDMPEMPEVSPDNEDTKEN